MRIAQRDALSLASWHPKICSERGQAAILVVCETRSPSDGRRSGQIARRGDATADCGLSGAEGVGRKGKGKGRGHLIVIGDGDKSRGRSQSTLKCIFHYKRSYESREFHATS